jgi:putative peptidoglycan lipid II flippase
MFLRNILNRESKVIISAALMLGFFSLLSKALGLLRDRIFAGEFSAGREMDIYFAAFRIPDLIYNIFIIGAVGAVFIPIFLERSQKSKKEALELTNTVLNIFVLAVIFFATLFAVFAPEIMSILVYGFSQEDIQKTADMTRIMLVGTIFLGISSILGNMLQANKRFFSYAIAPILYNIGIIFGALFLTKYFGVYGLALGVVFGALFHFLIQLPPAFKLGFKYRFSLNIFDPSLKKMVLLAGPRIAGLFAYQLNFIVITAIGSSLTTGSISIFNFANNLQFIPIGIVALSFVTAVFPFLSESYAKNNIKEFLGKFYLTVNQILFLVIPMSVFLILERIQIVRVILGTGQFSWEDTRLTAAALGLFALSVFSQSLVPLFSRAFFAMGDSKTPVFVNISSLAINVAFSFYFVALIKEGGLFSSILGQVLKVSDISDIAILGLPLAFSLGSIINLLWLYFLLSHRIKDFNSDRLLYSLSRINISIFFMVIFLYPTLHFVGLVVNMHTFLGIFLQGSAAFLVGTFVYLGSAYILKIPEFFAFWQAFTLPVKKMFLSKTYTSQVNGSEKL